MPKLGDFKTPTGGSGNVLNPMDWIAYIVGAMVLIITFAMGQNFANKLGGRVPGMDATIEQPWTSSPVYLQQANSKQNKVVL